MQSYCQRRSVNCRVHFFFSNQYSSFCRSGKIQADLAINLTAEMSWNHHSASDLHKPTQPACRYQYDSSKIKTKKIFCQNETSKFFMIWISKSWILEVWTWMKIILLGIYIDILFHPNDPGSKHLIDHSTFKRFKWNFFNFDITKVAW